MITTEANIAGPAVREALREGQPTGPSPAAHFRQRRHPEQVHRNRRWEQVQADPPEADESTRDESRQLLQLRAPNLDDDTADRLTQTLGDLPLGIEQAAVWLPETRHAHRRSVPPPE